MSKMLPVKIFRARVVATYRTLVYCVLAVSLFINYQTMYGKWNTVGLLLPDQPVQAASTSKDDWVATMAQAEEVKLVDRKGKRK